MDAEGTSRLHDRVPEYGSLAIAQSVPNAIVVADIAGFSTVFTCPAALVRCSESTLDELAGRLHTVCVGSDPQYHSPMLSFFSSGAGPDWDFPDGFVQDRLWVADDVKRFGWEDAASQVLSGTRRSLPEPLDGKPLDILWMVRDRIHDEARSGLKLIVEAATLAECQVRRGELETLLRRHGQDRAADALAGRSVG